MQSNKKRNFFERMGISTTAVADSGLCPKNPQTFEKIDQNFYKHYGSMKLY